MPSKISEFYDMSELFEDDLEMIVQAMKELAGAKEKPSILMVWIESLNMNRISGYTDKIMSLPMHSIKTWKISKLYRQTTLYDFIGE